MYLPLLLTDGIVVLLAALAGMAIGLQFFTPLFYISALFLVFGIYFFRNPIRCNPQALHNPNVILSPADGKVIAVTRDTLDAPEYEYRISIFLSVFDVHVNWTPIAGEIQNISYRPGTFSLAWLPKSSEKNERNELLIMSDNGHLVLVRQIAGAVARRISCWVKPGEKIPACHKIGMIRFGSRVDLFLPRNCRVDVKVGDYVYGGQTIVAEFADSD